MTSDGKGSNSGPQKVGGGTTNSRGKARKLAGKERATHVSSQLIDLV